MLLMIAPTEQSAPPEHDIVVEHGTVGVVPVRQGQLMTIVDVEGGRPVQLYAYTDADLGEFLSPHHTRVFTNSYRLTQGMRMVTNRRRPLMVLGKDTGRKHDLLMPASTDRTLVGGGGAREQFRAAIAAQGLNPIKVPDPINLFLDVDIGTDGGITPRDLQHAAGTYITCRVLIDCKLFVGACASDLPIAQKNGPVRVRVTNTL